LKNQYGPLARRIQLRWSNGLWLPPSLVTEDAKAAAEGKVDELFLMLMRRFAGQNRDVSPQKSPTYAPARFAEQPEAKKARASSRTLAEAMERLLAAGKVKVVPTDGPPSRRRTRLIEVVA
jgi:hypothetical protein